MQTWAKVRKRQLSLKAVPKEANETGCTVKSTR